MLSLAYTTYTQEAVKGLNQRFQAWVVDQVKQNPGVSLAENALEYMTYVSQLDARYLRKQGEVFTVRALALVVGGWVRVRKRVSMWREILTPFISPPFSPPLLPSLDSPPVRHPGR